MVTEEDIKLNKHVKYKKHGQLKLLVAFKIVQINH